jgi:hypothetical protein
LKLYSIRWRINGSASISDVSNLATVVNGTSYPAVASADGRYVTSTFPGGVLIQKGNSADVYIQGDITGSNSSGRVVEFDIDKTSDVYFVGQLYGYGVPMGYNSTGTVSASATHGTTYASSGQPVFQGSTFTIAGASITTIGKATEVPAQNVAINVPNQPLGGFVVDLKGENVSVQNHNFFFTWSGGTAASTNLLTSVSLVDDKGVVVAGPVDATNVGGGQQKAAFSDTVTYKTGRHVYTIKGKLPSTVSNGITITASTTPSTTVDWTNVTGQTTGNSITLSGSVFSMNTMTVRSATGSVTMSTQPSSQSIVAGGQQVVMANIQIDASQSGEDLRISSIKPRLAVVTGAVTDLTSCQVYDGSTILNTGSNVPTTAATNTFTFDNSLVVTKGTVKTLTLKCNVSTGAPSTATYTWSVNVSDSWTATGVQSGNSVTLSTTSGNAGTLTIGTGSLALTVDASSPSYTMTAGGTLGVTVGVFKLRATNEPVNLTKLGLTLDRDTTDNGSYTGVTGAQDLTQVYLYQGATLIGTATFTGNASTATSTLLSSLALAKDTDVLITVKADIADIGTSQPGTEGDRVVVDPSSFEGTGSNSGSTLTGAGTGATNGVRVFNTYPTLAADTLPSSGVADGRLMRFKVTANSMGNVGIFQVKFSVATSTVTSATNFALYGFTDSSYSNPISSGANSGGQIDVTLSTTSGTGCQTTNNSANGSSCSLSAGVATLTFRAPTATPVEVPASNTYYFELRSSVAGVQSGSSVVTTLLGDSTILTGMNTASSIAGSYNFTWSPNASTTSIGAVSDWTNGASVSGLPSSGIIQTRSN